MKRIFGRVFTICASALALGAFAPACVENDQSIFVRNVLAPSTNRQGGICSYSDDPQQPALFSGVFDVGVRDNYQAVVLVGSQLVGRGDPSNTRAEPNRVHINGAVVRVAEPDGATISEFTSVAAGFTDPGSNNNPDYGVFSIVAIDAPTSQNLRGQVSGRRATKQIVVFIKAFGKTLGGVDLESGEYQFPITVCNGCLVDFSTADTARPLADQCKGVAAGATGGGQEQVPCNPGQDESTPCQLCQGRPVCDPAQQ